MNAIRHLPLHTSVSADVRRLAAKNQTKPAKVNVCAVVVCAAVIIDAAAIVALLGFMIGVIAANL